MNERTLFELKIFACLMTCAYLVGCVATGEPDHPDPSPFPGGNVNPALAGAALPLSHLPCEIESIVRTRCRSCHAPNSPLHQVSLLTHADFAQPSKSLPTLTYAQQALQLIQTGMMPPTSALAAGDVQLFAAWVQGGAVTGECGIVAGDAGIDAGGMIGIDAGALEAGWWSSGAPIIGADAGFPALDAGNPFATPTTCTSGQRWMGGDMRSESMHPGRACIDCHTTGAGSFNLQHGPSFTFAGTVFPSAHEPDDCNGAPGGGVSIVIKGANGQTQTLTPNAVGNFHAATRVTAPYTAEVHFQGRVRAMTTPQTMGDCNRCHTERGANGAPGRIMLP